MNVKELIKLLQAEDPNADVVCEANNGGICSLLLVYNAQHKVQIVFDDETLKDMNE